nr:EAL domain-containing protein [Rhodanobacter sp. DHG33]
MLCGMAANAAVPASAASVPAPTHIRVASSNDYPPFLFLDADGKPQGYEVDMWRLFQAHTGIKVDLEPTSWNGALQNMQADRADVIDMLYRAPSRETQYDFSEPYADLPVGIYVDRRIAGVRDIDTLRGFPVGVERGDVCAERLRSQGLTNLHEFDGYEDIVKAAALGNLRIFCMDEYPADFYLYRYSAIDRFYQAFVIYTGQAHRAVRKGDTAMLQVVERGMAEITPHEREALRERWLEHPLLLGGYLRTVGIVLMAVLALVSLMALWVSTLRRRVAARTSELLAEQGKLRAIFDASPDAMWVKDRADIYRDGNDRVATLFRAGCEAPQGRHGDELFDPAFAARVRALDAEAVHRIQHVGDLLSLRDAAGGERRLEVISVPLLSSQGEVSGVLSTARDVTERLRAEAQLRLWAHAFENAAFSMYLCDARSRRVIAVNPAFAAERGYKVEEMVGMPVDALYPADLVAERAAARREVDRHEHAVWESEHVTRDGRRFPVRVDCSVFHDADGRAQHVLVYAQDISERRRLEGELRLAAVAFQTQEALMVTDAERTILRVNQAFVALTGYGPEEVVGRRSTVLRSRHHAPDVYENLWSAARRDGSWVGEAWIQPKQGPLKVVRTSISAVTGSNGQISHFVCSMVDFTGEREAHASIDRMTYFDPLTDLSNRHFLLGRLQHLLDEGEAHGVALLMFDLDHFKRINDLRGHAAGDRLLVRMAQRLRGLLGDECVLSRFGGGTFALLLPGSDGGPTERAARVLDYAERVRQSLQRPFQLDDGVPAGMTVSIGWAEVAPGCDSSETVLKQAELAMYAAKAAGRDRVCGFEPAMQDELAQREALMGDLRRAIAEKVMDLHVQAQVDRRGRVVGAEMLLRWTRPDGRQVSPEEFIPVIEENGLILPLGEWVLRQACACLVDWSGHSATRVLGLAVNMSARQFAQPGFVEEVRQALSVTGADPAMLTLEITETAILDDLDEAAGKLAQLRALGIRISLDDFGTGYSSLAYLSHLPLDQLKIDQSFVARLPDDANDAMVARTIIGMGRGLGLQVVAEGVETEAQQNFLMAEGCEVFQGYLISRPMPLQMFERILQERPNGM